MEDKILISSGWCRVRPHHILTFQSESSHDLDPFWSAETLFNTVSTKICNLKGRERILMLTLKQADVRLEYKARVDSLCLILGQTLTGSKLRLRTYPGLVLDRS